MKAILFDKDGTFVDFDRTWGPAALRVMEAMAGADRDALARLVAVSHYDLAALRFRPTSPLVAGSSADYGPLWADALGVPFSADVTDAMDRLFVQEGLAGLAPIGEPARLFARLKARGLALGVVTNDSETGAVAQCERLGLLGHVDFLAGWDSGFGRKPAPGQITAFLDRFGLSGGEVAMVGDSLHDIRAARAAGVLAVGVSTGPVVTEEFEREAHVVLPSIMTIEAWLDQASEAANAAPSLTPSS